MKSEKQKILKSLIPPFLFVLLIWLVKIGEILTHTELTMLGIYPLRIAGLPGIFTSPLVHKDMDHLLANSIPLFVLGGALFYFYREIAVKIFILILLITGISVWIGGREAYHIGASGLAYGLASFLFTSGIIRREPRLLAITMLVTFLYGSMVWGIFPDFFPEKNISYEAHFWGLVSGVLLAFYYKSEGPQRRKYDWEDEEEAGDFETSDGNEQKF